MKPISPTVHGIFDGAFVASSAVMSRALREQAPLSRLLAGSAVAVAVISACTSYRWGLVKLLSIRAHLTLESPISATFMAAPILFRDLPRSATVSVAAMGVGGTAVALLTQTSPEAHG